MEKLYLEAWLCQRFLFLLLFFSRFGFFVLGILFLRIIWQWPEMDIDPNCSWLGGWRRKQNVKWGSYQQTSFVPMFKILSWLFPHLLFSLRFYKDYRWDCSDSFSHSASGSAWGCCRPPWEEWWECGLLVGEWTQWTGSTVPGWPHCWVATGRLVRPCCHVRERRLPPALVELRFTAINLISSLITFCPFPSPDGGM